MKKRLSKKLLSIFLVVLIVFSMVPIASVPAYAATTPATVDDATVKARFDKLRTALAGKYFTVNQTYCYPSPGEGGHPPEDDCSNCLNRNVIKTSWLKNSVGLVPDSISLVPGHYTINGSFYSSAWSCIGFANFVEWYLYAQKSTDDVYVRKLGNVDASYNGLKSVGAKIGNVLYGSAVHSVVLYSYDANSITYIQCNGTRQVDGNCRVTFVTQSYSAFRNLCGSTIAVTQAQNSIHTHNYLTEYEAAHPHKQYTKCYGCGNYSYTGVTRRVDSCSSCLEHTCSYLTEYEAAHPHKQYMKCYDCGDYSYTGVTRVVESCSYCNEKFTITYNANEGTGAPTSQTKIYGQTLILSSTIPTRSGYIFLGWTTDDNSTIVDYVPGDEYALNQDITLYALWSLEHLHNYDYVVTKVPTCTETGMATLTCECGDEYTEELFATGHQNTMWITEQESTCDVAGYKDEYCLDCGEKVGTEEIPATGHQNTTWVIEEEPTCDAPGYKDEYCLDCGDKVGTEEIPANGHTLSTEWTIDIAPTCTEAGSKSHHCTVCEAKDDITVIASLGHDYKVISIEEEHPHTISYKCSRCPETKEETSTSIDCAVCNFSYTNIDNETCKITGYIGSASIFVMPGTIEGRTVTTTTTGAFKNNTTLTSVRIQSGVQGLGSLAFLGCTSLSKIIIPESVASIGTNAFYNCASDFTIYCYRDSYAMQYAIDNSLNYVIMDIGETENTRIDYVNKIIFTTEKFKNSIDDIIYTPATSMAFAEASMIYGNNEYLGTGSIVTVFDDNNNLSEYTLIVEGDLNGDSVVDVLDAAAAQLYSSGFHEPTENEILAANGCIADEIDVNAYQNVVNTCLAS